MRKLFKLFILPLLVLALISCQPPAQKPVSTATVAEWSKNAVLYEVNIRQYTPEGTFKAFEKHLPRLKELGVDILWIMPISSDFG